MPKLLSLDEHDATIQELARDWTQDLPVKNGIACPTCGKELFDTHPASVILGCNVPKKHIHCRCGYRGSRLA